MNKTVLTFAVAGALSSLAGSLSAQPGEKRVENFGMALPAPPPGPGGDVLMFRSIEGGPRESTFDFIRAEMAFGGKTVTGAPYSAESVTETTQMLADGNRISRKTSSRVARDSEGRVRREQTLPAIGPWASSGEAPMMVFIDDPVSGSHYVLNSKDKTARKLPLRGPGGNGRIVQMRSGVVRGLPGTPSGDAIVPAPAPAGFGPAPVAIARFNPGTAREEDLGVQIIEGVKAEGKRSIRTIPAGAIGNDLPIEIISETWHSPELQTTVMSRHEDPRFGKTVHRLTGVQRSEPIRSLFEVPADYKIIAE